MKKLLVRLSLVLLFTIWAFYLTFPWKAYNINMPFTWNDYKLGLDLQGWVELDYKVDLDEVSKEAWYNSTRENSIIEWLKSIVDKRVEALKISDSSISTASYWNEKHIIVQIPLKWTNKEENELNIKRAKEAIWRVMKIEFKEQRTQITDADLAERKQIATDLKKEASESKYSFSVTSTKYKDSYENVQSWNMTWSLNDLKKYFSLNKDSIKNWLYSELVSWTWLTNYKVSWETNDKWYWILSINSFKNDILDFDYAFVSANPSEWMAAKDSKWRILNDKYFKSSSVQTSETFQPMVELNFNDEWADIFGELTTRLKWQPIAIFVWGQLLTAPTVNDAILTWKAVITWTYSPSEAKKLSDDINTWVVPAPIYLTSEKSIDSKLWINSLHELLIAWVYWFLVILVFLVVVYRMAWLVSAFALVIYSLATILIIKEFWIVLTLASIAWLILSVWMAIDANILIFERIKDELRLWSNLDKALVNWFDKSWSAIWDSNLTWIIIAIILYVFWINMIKWFWLVLWIWLVVSLFSAMFISRLFVLLLSKNKKLSLKTFIWMDK